MNGPVAEKFGEEGVQILNRMWVHQLLLSLAVYETDLWQHLQHSLPLFIARQPKDVLKSLCLVTKLTSFCALCFA